MSLDDNNLFEDSSSNLMDVDYNCIEKEENENLKELEKGQNIIDNDKEEEIINRDENNHCDSQNLYELNENEYQLADNKDETVNNEESTCLENNLNSDNDDDDDVISVISMGDKVVLNSNQKRLCKRLEYLQTSITNLKGQLTTEKLFWKESVENANQNKFHYQHASSTSLTTNQYDNRSTTTTMSICVSYESQLNRHRPGCPHYYRNLRQKSNSRSIKKLLDLENYRRQLAETQSMCDLELTRIKKSLESLRNLQALMIVWGDTCRDKSGDEQYVDCKSTVKSYLQ